MKNVVNKKLVHKRGISSVIRLRTNFPSPVWRLQKSKIYYKNQESSKWRDNIICTTCIVGSLLKSIVSCDSNKMPAFWTINRSFDTTFFRHELWKLVEVLKISIVLGNVFPVIQGLPCCNSPKLIENDVPK